MRQRSTVQPPPDLVARPIGRHRVPAGLRLAAAAVFVGLSFLPARSADGQETRPVRSLLEIRQAGVVVQEWDLSCGAAALATLLAYQHGDPVPEREIAEAMVRRDEYIANPELVQIRQGFSLLDLKRYVDGRGYEGIGFGQLALEDLVENAPILVPVNFNGYNHFVVFRGLQGDRVLLADPAYGNRVVSLYRFENAWLDSPQFGRVGFVVARRDGVDPPNRMAPDPNNFIAPPDALLRTIMPLSGQR